MHATMVCSNVSRRCANINVALTSLAQKLDAVANDVSMLYCRNSHEWMAENSDQPCFKHQHSSSPPIAHHCACQEGLGKFLSAWLQLGALQRPLACCPGCSRSDFEVLNLNDENQAIQPRKMNIKRSTALNSKEWDGIKNKRWAEDGSHQALPKVRIDAISQRIRGWLL